MNKSLLFVIKPVDVAASAGIAKSDFAKLFAGDKMIIAREVYLNQLRKNKK